MSRQQFLRAAALVGLMCGPGALQLASAAGAAEESIAAVRRVGTPTGDYAAAAQSATRLRSTMTVDDLPTLLDAMKDVDPVAANWLRGIVADVARQAETLPIESLQSYSMNRDNNPLGRGMAMELIAGSAPELAGTLISKCLDDPSLPLREMAVEQAMGRASQAADSGDEGKAIAIYRESLTSARNPTQLRDLVDALKKLDQPVSLSDAFEMITDWKAIGPFDNVDGVGFDKVYPPETEFADSASVNLDAKHEGKNGVVVWQSVEGSDDDGKVNLAATYDKEKGAVAYLLTEFESANDQPVEARLSCVTANKVWINGEEVMANEVYHSGSAIDQYVSDAKLKQGRNTILLKICQNEQTEGWAQDWEFQFRLTDPNGEALTSEK